MRISQLTKYMKSRLSNCIYCGEEITDNQEFQYCSTKVGRYIAYAFIHNDCIAAAQRYVSNQKYADIKEAFHSGKTHANMSSYSTQDKVEHIDRASTYTKLYSKEEVVK